MSRPAKRKRDELRFGRPERLADTIIQSPWNRWRLMVGASIPAGRVEGHAEVVERFRRDVAVSPVLVIDNVAEFFFDHPQQDWEYDKHFPNSSPLFETFLVEFASPRRVLTRDGWVESDLSDRLKARQGFLFHFEDTDSIKSPPPKSLRGEDGKSIDLSGYSRAKWAGTAVYLGAAEGRPTYTGLALAFAVDSRGQIVVDPFTIGNGVRFDDFARIAQGARELLSPALLAISFAHCKNLQTICHDPPAEFNRERRKAGLKPFVRYHTIQIEPMKSVLKHEGGIEEHGLKRALHICHGHFATYSDSLMGRKLEKPVTVWRPSHVRGTAKVGVVISDYEVKAPKGAIKA